MVSYKIEENDSNRRLDRIVRHFLKDVPISFIYSSIRKGKIRLNGKKTEGSTITSLGDELYIDDDIFSFKRITSNKIKLQEKNLPSSSVLLKRKNSKIDILFKNEHLLFINKEGGIATHGKGSIDDEVKEKSHHLMSLSFSVGALHRLDKDTTGVLTFSQSLKGAQFFSKAIQENKIDRYYIGINEGRVETRQWKIKNEHKTCEITDVFLLEYSHKANLSLCVYKLITGKKHQIRKAASYFATPLFCDARYGSKRKDYPKYFLHSFMLFFRTSLFPDIPSKIVAPLPQKFLKIINTYFPNTKKNIDNHSYDKLIKEIMLM